MIFAAYVISDGCLLDEGFLRGNVDVAAYLRDGLLEPGTFAARSQPKDLFELVRKEDVDRLMVAFPTRRLHYVASDGCALLLRDEMCIRDRVNRAGLEILGIESVNIHDDIKIGLPTRDRYIENYIETIRILAECGIDLICYNFMPVFDWTRTDLAKPRPDGSTVLAYDQAEIDKIDPANMFAAMERKADGYLLPG